MCKKEKRLLYKNIPISKDYREIKNLKATQEDPKTITLKGSDKLYRNNGKGKFIDATLSAGILTE